MCVVGEGVEGHFVKHFLRYGEAFYTEGFEIDFSVCDAALELVASPPLDPVHGTTGGADDED
jgi:hypothetical protein